MKFGETYTFILRSTNKLSGTNNNMNINVPFSRILNNAPYKKFQLRSALYTNNSKINDNTPADIDQENCEIRISLPSINEYDSINENAGYLVSGIARRKFVASITPANYAYLVLEFRDSFKHIINKPQNDFLNIQMINPKNNLPYRTISGANTYEPDSGAYILVLELQGIIE